MIVYVDIHFRIQKMQIVVPPGLFVSWRSEQVFKTITVLRMGCH